MDITERIAKIVGSLHIELAGKEVVIEQLQAEIAELKDSKASEKQLKAVKKENA